MATITKPMALDESFNTTESTSRNQADVLVGIEQAIVRGFGQVANAVSYDNTDSGLTADNVQDAIDEVDDTVDGLVDDVTEISSDIESTKTASGNPLTLTDCAPINAESLVVELQPKQDLHGQDAPYVGGAGKNKLPMTVDGIKAENTDGTWSGNSYTIYGVTYTILTDDGGNVTGININGTNNQSSYASLWICDYAEIPGQCIVNGWAVSGDPNSAYVQINKKPIGGGAASIEGYLYTDQDTLNLSDTSYLYTYIIYVPSGKTVNNLLALPMFRLSTETDPTFAPYSNICPITGYTQTSVEGCGKNLWGGIKFAQDIKDKKSDSVLDTTNKTIEPSGYEPYVDLYSDFKANTRYTLILRALTAASSKGTNLRVVYTDNTYNDLFLDATTNGKLVYNSIEGKSISYIGNIGQDTPPKLLYDECGLFEGVLTLADFVPYASTSATIQFGQTVYGGSVDFTTGVLTVDRASVDLGTLSWGTPDANGCVGSSRLQDAKPITSSSAVSNIVCSSYKAISARDWYNAQTMGIAICGRGYGGDETVGIFDTTLIGLTSAQVVQKMSGVMLCYELAEPFTIQLTPQELKLLQDTNNLTTNGTTINLGYQPDNVIGELKGEIEKCTPNPEFMHFEVNGNVVDAVPIIFDEAIHSYTVSGDNWKDKTFLCVECCDMRYGILQLVLSSDMAFVDSCGKALMLYPYMRSIEQYIKITISLGQSYGYEISYQTTNTSSLLDYLKIRVRLFN